ncbi:hypothetical protein L2755_14970 [Shewanella abyssi]|uniref:hypothetical protein n=1 Tax=Shewanella abyssi TaxID=311789 RepID=UPI00200D999E|nr:hypothetical protein [Shewanella abyssi]MCL1050919.1 hypothetical protein [Shewanella abyssi]
MSQILEKVLVNLPLIVSVQLIYLLLQVITSEGEEKTDFALSAFFNCLYYGSGAVLYSLLAIIFLLINKQTMKHTLMKMALVNLFTPLAVFGVTLFVVG